MPERYIKESTCVDLGTAYSSEPTIDSVPEFKCRFPIYFL